MLILIRNVTKFYFETFIKTRLKSIMGLGHTYMDMSVLFG